MENKDQIIKEERDRISKKLVTDFPTAWKILGSDSIDTEQHHEKCSTRQTQGAILCDCAAEKAFLQTINYVLSIVNEK